jgi:broad specificity phosphatase PhoE
MPVTMLFLLRHGATAANLEQPYRLQGRRCDNPLDPIGIRQAELTRDLLASRPINFIYSSPLKRALQTAAIIAAPHGHTVQVVEALTECDVGRWEGHSWDGIRQQFPREYHRFTEDPGMHGYLGGENFSEVAARVTPVLDDLLLAHQGKTILVVSHHVVNRVYLAGLLGLAPSEAKRVSLDNCGVSVVTHNGDKAQLTTLNATLHLSAPNAGAC